MTFRFTSLAFREKKQLAWKLVAAIYLFFAGMLLVPSNLVGRDKVEAYELPALYHTYEEEKATRFFTTLFDSELPITAKPNRWSFRYNIKAGDLLDESYLRRPVTDLHRRLKSPYRGLSCRTPLSRLRKIVLGLDLNSD